MNYKSANTQSARNAGLVAVGAMTTLIFWPLIGYYAVLQSFVVGACTYTNDRVQENSPSKFDPLYTFSGGLLIGAFMYARHFL